MIATTLRQCASFILVPGLMASVLCFEAGAAETAGPAASPWDGDARSAIRLVAGSTAAAKSDILRAGVELRFAAGWKTYWRYPGDSGVPPAFDFSKSSNVKSVDVLWPAPHRFTEEGVATIGYKDSLMLPLHVVAQNPKQSVTLRLAIDYAICEKLCVPAKGAATLQLSAAASPHDAALAAAETAVPQEASLGAPSRGNPPTLAIRSVRRVPGTPHERVEVDVAAPAAAPLDLFVEGPTAEWSLPLPEPAPGGAPGTRRYAFELDGLPPGVSPVGARLRFTLVSGDKAIDVTTVLD